VELRTNPNAMPVPEAMERLARFPFVLVSWVGDDRYPVSVVTSAEIGDGGAVIRTPAGIGIPTDREVSLTGSHIRPQPGVGYDERRHLTVWGRLDDADPSRFVPARAWGWDESNVPFPEYAERTVPQSQRYLERVSAETGRRVRPTLALGWLVLRATRLPFLSATVVPVLIGIAIAAARGSFDLLSALLTVIGAAAIHLGLNVANDIFDARSGADAANVNPTQYSGGSRVIQYGLVSERDMVRLGAGLYLVGIAVGLALLALRGSVALLVIGVIGVLLSVFYTAPPLKLVYRGLGEVTTAIGFGPLMLVGAAVVQTRGVVPVEALVASVPIAILVALILYVNEIPDRPSDASAGKRTLPVRLPRETVIALYDVAAVATFVVIGLAVAAGILPIPALLALLAAPLALRVHRGLTQYYDQPYGLMAVMAVNIRLHLVVGVVLLLAYVAVIVASAIAPGAPLFLR
jgi:1,4-dihydroxy-2-naphthoate polyprenyltransferase